MKNFGKKAPLASKIVFYVLKAGNVFVLNTIAIKVGLEDHLKEKHVSAAFTTSKLCK